MQVKSRKHYRTRAVLERKKKPWHWEAKWGLQTSVEYPCIDRTEKKRCEGTIGDNKNVDRLKVWSCAVKELKRTGEKGRWWITKVMWRDPTWCKDKHQKQRWKLKTEKCNVEEMQRKLSVLLGLSFALRLTWAMSFLVTHHWVWPEPGATAPRRGHRRIGERVSEAGRAGGWGRDGSCRAMVGWPPW